MYQDHHENLKDMNEIECTALVNGHKHLYSFGREKKYHLDSIALMQLLMIYDFYRFQFWLYALEFYRLCFKEIFQHSNKIWVMVIEICFKMFSKHSII